MDEEAAAHKKEWSLKENQRFWAFVLLVIIIALLAIWGSTLGDVHNSMNEAELMLTSAKLRLVDGAVVGLIGIAGMAAQSLFRTSETEKKNAEVLHELSQKVPPPTVPPEEVTPAPATSEQDEEGIPDYAR